MRNARISPAEKLQHWDDRLADLEDLIAAESEVQGVGNPDTAFVAWQSEADLDRELAALKALKERTREMTGPHQFARRSRRAKEARASRVSLASTEPSAIDLSRVIASALRIRSRTASIATTAQLPWMAFVVGFGAGEQGLDSAAHLQGWLLAKRPDQGWDRFFADFFQRPRRSVAAPGNYRTRGHR